MRSLAFTIRLQTARKPRDLRTSHLGQVAAGSNNYAAANPDKQLHHHRASPRVLKVSAAPALGEEVLGEITVRPDKSAVTVAVTGGDYDMSSQTIIGPDSWIAPTTLCQRCGACEAGMVPGWRDSSQKFE